MPVIYCIILLFILLPICVIITLQLIQIINLDYKHNQLKRKENLGYLALDDILFLVSIFIKKKLWFSSIKILEKQLRKDLEINYRYFNLIGFSYYGMKQYEMAKIYYSKALDCKPDYLIALKNLAKVSELTNDLSGALFAYSSILSYDPLNTFASNALIKIKNRDSRI
uniref:Uncharacterized protein n=1 Tax=Synarthrophyton chejuense TaxID=2485825 RepID=A0A3G3MFR0_9FLOR|nr:hypothetical protein [Synarthrophyton chejuense]AYR05665.1 hypothetical protein [Synarthrophyton chejuense]